MDYEELEKERSRCLLVREKEHEREVDRQLEMDSLTLERHIKCKQIFRVREFMPKYLGILFWKRCPLCHSSLKQAPVRIKGVKLSAFGTGYVTVIKSCTYYWCPSSFCDYEYANNFFPEHAQWDLYQGWGKSEIIPSQVPGDKETREAFK